MIGPRHTAAQRLTASNALITRDYEGHTFLFREDGYFNMTKAAKAFGKRMDNFLRTIESRDYCFEL